jgi:hypothetical protein
MSRLTCYFSKRDCGTESVFGDDSEGLVKEGVGFPQIELSVDDSTIQRSLANLLPS